MPLHKALFAETSPGPVKYAASLLGLCGDEVRLPLAPIAAETKARVKAALKGAGLLG
jgi:4-hydroxy-tetrahydrodipicolinate synthase